MRGIMIPGISILAVAAVVTLSLGCEEEKKSTNLSASITVATTVQAGFLKASTNTENAALDGDEFARTSFNPTSFQVHIMGMLLCKGLMNLDGSCPDTRDSPYMSGNGAIELAGKKALDPISTFSNSEITEQYFGVYNSISLGFPGDLEDGIAITGSATVDGRTISLNSKAVYPPSVVTSVNFAKPLTLDENSAPNFSIIIDIEDPVYLSLGAANSGSTEIESDVNARVPGWIIIPYVGTGTPVVETYDVVFDTDDMGTRGSYSLRVTAVKDTEGVFYGAGWAPSYAEGYRYGTYMFQPQVMQTLLTEVTGDSYKFTTGTTDCSESTMNNRWSCMTLPAFKLSTHSGTATVGGISYNYTATKR